VYIVIRHNSLVTGANRLRSSDGGLLHGKRLEGCEKLKTASTETQRAIRQFYWFGITQYDSDPVSFVESERSKVLYRQEIEPKLILSVSRVRQVSAPFSAEV